MGHGAIVGLVQELSATSDNLRDALDRIGDVDTPKMAVSLLPYLLPDANIGFVYEGDVMRSHRVVSNGKSLMLMVIYTQMKWIVIWRPSLRS